MIHLVEHNIYSFLLRLTKQNWACVLSLLVFINVTYRRLAVDISRQIEYNAEARFVVRSCCLGDRVIKETQTKKE